MPYYTQKLLTALLMPLEFASSLLWLVLVWRAVGWRRGENALLVTAILTLWMASSPLVGVALVGSLEASYPPIAVEAVPVSDVKIVLGGIVEPASFPRVQPELRESVDRLTYAARLFAAGKAPKLLLSAGGGDVSSSMPPESEAMAEVLTWLGVPRSAMVLESQSRTTRENALRTAELWRSRGYQSGLLVTSAFHMRRATLEFRCAGLTLTPASADIWVSDHQKDWILQWLPNATMLTWTTVAVKEYLGLAVARLRPCRSTTASRHSQSAIATTST